jgi:hypothetical protein
MDWWYLLGKLRGLGGRFWIQQAVTFMSIAAPIFFGAWKLSKDRQAATEARKEEHRETLRMSIYDQIAEKLFLASDSLSQTGVRVSTFGTRLQALTALRIVPSRQPIESVSFSELATLHYTATDRLISVMKTIEKYEIAIPGFDEFKRLVSASMDKLGKTFIKFSEKAGPFCPADPQDLFQPPLPTGEAISGIKELGNEYGDCVASLEGYLWDLRVEAQNYLLGSLFESRAKKREPGDPTVSVFALPTQQL